MLAKPAAMTVAAPKSVVMPAFIAQLLEDESKHGGIYSSCGIIEQLKSA